MKLLTFYNETFSKGLEYVNAIWDIAKQDSSLNGFYICVPEFVKEGYLGSFPSTNTLTWYNLLADGNYLYGNNLIRIANSSAFNNKPCIEFNDAGNTQLVYRFPVTVGTLILVYLVRVAGSYIVYAPRTTNSPNTLYYDAFPAGATTLWVNEPLTNGSIYNATSRINAKQVPSNTFVPLNSARVLSVKDIANIAQQESISGYGGQIGAIGGSVSQGLSNSLKGSLAAVITYENNIDTNLLREIELALGQYYIQYNGVVQTIEKSFKQLVGTSFSFDFSTIFLDEWFDITNYELIYPTTLNLSFTGSVLAGTLDVLYDDKLTIAVTNSANRTKHFSFDLLVCRQDPLAIDLPLQTNLKIVLSANKAADGGLYGLKLNELNQVIQWEDARRISNNTLYTYSANENKPCQYIETSSYFNNQSSVQFTSNSRLFSSFIGAKTFIWVYKQDFYGNRNMLNTFPDIKGTGVLWTVSNTTETHGNTNVTRLDTKVQRIGVNTLNFKMPLNVAYIITAVVTDNNAIDFSAFENMRGELAFFAAWDTVLTTNQLNNAVALLAARYANSLAPYIFDTSTEFRFLPNISVDLKTKVADLQNLTLTYSLVNSVYDAAIDSEGVLTFTGIKDEVLEFSIDVTNSLNLTSRLTFNVDIAIRPNSLYLALKNILGTSLTRLFIAELDTFVLDNLNILEWEDYRLNDYIGTGNNISLVTLAQLNSKYAVDFDIDGSSYLELPVSSTGSCFGIVYVRKQNASSRAFLMGQDSTADFLSGLNGILWDNNTSRKILNADTYVNGVSVSANYKFTPSVLNTVLINTTEALTINSIAKDRVFTDRSIKGYVPLWFVLNRTITDEEASALNKSIRDYYDPARFITLLHLDGDALDSSASSKIINSNATYSVSIKKFGSHSCHLVNNSVVRYLEIPNDIEYAFLLEDFTISYWLQFNKVLDTNDVLSIYSQTNLLMYINGNKLYVGRNYATELSLMNTTLPAINTFHHIALVRKANVLSLYVNGNRIDSVNDTTEYTDYNTLIRIGQRTGITTSNVNIYIDEVAVYKRAALHTGDNFTPPSAPYDV